MTRLPGSMFVVDIKKESIAIKEAQRLNIPVFAIVDTNCDPDEVDHIVPANDDAVKTIELVVTYMADAVMQGTAIAKEKKSEEAAEAERVAKETNAQDKTPGDEEKPKVEKRPRKVIKKIPVVKSETKEVKEAPEAETEKEENTEKE
jgi:small subunit ribosomal protein S2